MLKITLYCILIGQVSPSQWERSAGDSQVCQWLGRGIHPSLSRWYVFSDRIARHLDDWNRQVLAAVIEEGHSTATEASFDGTFVEADAGRHQPLNQTRLEKRLEQLDEAIQDDEALQNGTEQADRPEPSLEKRPYWMASTPAGRLVQQRRYQLAENILAQRLEENELRQSSDRKKPEKIYVSAADPEAPFGRDKLKVFRPLYNVQIMRDLGSRFIFGYGVFAQTSDAGTLGPMLDRTKELTSMSLEKVLVDSGYVTALDLAEAKRRKVDLVGPWKENDFSRGASTIGAGSDGPLGKDNFSFDPETNTYRCPGDKPLTLKGSQNRQRSGGRVEQLSIFRTKPSDCSGCPLKPRCSPNSKSGRTIARSEYEDLIDEHRARMAEASNQILYKSRRQTVEPAIGDFKQHRAMRRIRGRGLLRAKSQVALTVLASNAVTLEKARRASDPEKHEP